MKHRDIKNHINNLSIIVAIAGNNAIGKDNQLLCHISEDLKRFKRLTTGHSVIMGQHTFRSLPKAPLPNRDNIVLSRTMKQAEHSGINILRSIEEVLRYCKDQQQECFIMGGAQIYEQFYPLAGKMYVTQIHQSFEADTFFPVIEEEAWIREVEEENIKDTTTGLLYSYINFYRKGE